MAWRYLATACLAWVLLVPAAQASHMGMYQQNPLEHDAQGTVLEPDGLGTAVLGRALTNCVLDLPPFDGRCVPDPVPKPAGALGAVLAPGCTGGHAPVPERRLGGQCALWSRGVNGIAAGTIPAPVSEPGMSGDAAPGGYTPTKAHTVRFLDGHLDWTVQPPAGGTVVLDLNRHLAEADRLSGLRIPAKDNVLPGTNFAWAWYGQWTDRNGNGVVDHQTPGPGPLGLGRRVNEFAWLGSCTNFDGAREPLSISLGVCIEDGNPNLVPPGAPCEDPESVVGCAGATMHGWLFPGNHHAGGPADDIPGQQAVLWAGLLFDCQGPPSCDDIDRDNFGDPLFGVQDERTEDMDFHDRTGDMEGDTARQWSGGGGWATYFYGDDGLLVSFVQVWGVNCGATSGPNRFDLRSCTFLDVDRQLAIDEDAEALLVGSPEAPTGGLKAAARSGWVVVRDVGTTVFRGVQAQAFNRDVYLLTQGETQGDVDDTFLQAGWSREPNTPFDRYVGTAYKRCSEFPVGDPRNPTDAADPEELEAQHRGWCNVGANGAHGEAYTAHRQAARGWLDAQAQRSLVYSVPVTLVPGVQCQYCLAGPVVDFPYTLEPAEVPPTAEDHARTLGPGMYWWGGPIGVWRDRAAQRDEAVFPEPAPKYQPYPIDGWVGLAARNSGQWVYRNFNPVECATEQDPPNQTSLHSAAECNPYLDGNIEDPQDYTTERNGGEFRGACDNANLRFTLEPADGHLQTQILVWREHSQGIAPDPLDLDGDGHAPIAPTIEGYGPGPVAPLVLGASCAAGGFWRMNDYLLWPEGNHGDDIVTRMTKSISLGVDLDGDQRPDADVITDVDVYADWEPL